MTIPTESQRRLLPREEDDTTAQDHWLNQDAIDGHGHLLMATLRRKKEQRVRRDEDSAHGVRVREATQWKDIIEHQIVWYHDEY